MINNLKKNVNDCQKLYLFDFEAKNMLPEKWLVGSTWLHEKVAVRST